MNAFELYELTVETKSVEERGVLEYTPITLEDLQASFDGFLDKKIAEKIIAAHKELHEENNKNGNFSNNYYYIIERSLSEIEL